MNIDGTVIGMGDSPLVRLRQAVTGESLLPHFAANWYTPLAHSIVAVRCMFHDRFPPTDLMYCPSVYTAFPIQLAQYLEVMSPNTARIATDGRCSNENVLHLQGLLIQLMPLVVSRPVPTLADVADRLCDPQYNWHRLAHCAARARAEQAAPLGTTAAFRLGPYNDTYWAIDQGFELCRGIRNETSRAGSGEPARAMSPLRRAGATFAPSFAWDRARSGGSSEEKGARAAANKTHAHNTQARTESD
ncbi:hypothetical protein T492DRAFT_894171 [Pavlovales sp. CCMP2436]|nr:hypothetical protein T492DRAFT_894171 [Pavlovales sp. CCMP2436]